MTKKMIRAALCIAGVAILCVAFLPLSQVSAADGDNYYWVGGSGNWSDYSNHWATTSGGAVFHGAAPNATNNVYNEFSHLKGTLVTNGYSVTCGAYTISGEETRVLTPSSSTVSCTSWNYSGSNLTLSANTATINCSGNFSGGGLTTYNIVNLTGATSTISGSNTFNTLGLTRAGVQTITFTDGTTQTVTNFTRNVGTQVKTLQGSGVAGWAITKAGGGTAYMDYISVSRSTASPAATFIAGANSTNGGNNVNWTFVADVVTNDESNINTHETTLNGTITTNGSNATRRGFQFGTVSGALTGDWYEDGSFGDGAYSVQLTGLAGDTTYYYRAYSVTGGITEYGAELSFTTRDAAWLLVRFILPIVVAFGLILGVIGAWGGNGKISMIGIAIGLAGFIMIQAIISTI